MSHSKHMAVGLNRLTYPHKSSPKQHHRHWKASFCCQTQVLLTLIAPEHLPEFHGQLEPLLEAVVCAHLENLDRAL